MKQITPNRIEWIDNAKGIGILLVVIAHVIDQVETLSSASTVIYTFHMPLFFILSGFTISQKTMSLSIKQLFLKYFKSLGIPYFFHTAINMLIWFLVSKEKSFHTALVDAYELLTLNGWKSTWFLPALFFAQIITIVAVKRVPNKILLLSFSCVISLAVAFVSSHIPSVLRSLALGLVTFPFVMCGILMHDDRVQRFTRSWLALSISLAIIFASAYFNGRVDLKWFNFGRSPFIWLVSGIIGSLSVIWISYRINSRLLTKAGQNSLVIMCIHITIMLCMYYAIIALTQNQYIQLITLLISTICITWTTCPFASSLYLLFYARLSKLFHRDQSRISD